MNQMKLLMFVMALILMITFNAFGQLPIPTEPPEIKYKAQICWGAIDEAKWQDIVITYTVKTGTVPTSHKYNSKTGLQTFISQASNSSTNIVEFSFNIASLPSNSPDNKFWYYYCRLIGYTEVDDNINPSPFSDPSWWVSIHEIGKPSKPVGR